MKVAKWLLGLIIFLALSFLILEYGEVSINLIIIIAFGVFILSLIQNRRKEKKHYQWGCIKINLIQSDKKKEENS